MDEIRTKLIYDLSEYIPAVTKQIDLHKEIDKAYEANKASAQASSKEQIKALNEVTNAESEAINSLKEHSKEIANLKKERTGLNGLFDKFRNTLQKNGDQTKKLTADRISLLRTYSTEKKALKEGILNANIFGTSLAGMSGGIKQLVTVSNLFIKVLGRTKVALISTGIGAFVVLLGSLFTYLTKTQSGLDKVTRFTKQFGAAISVVTDRLAALGKTFFDGNLFEKAKDRIQKFWSNPIKAFKDSVKETIGLVKDVAEEIKTETEITGRLEDAKVRLRNVERDIAIETAKQRKEIKALNLVAEDTTRTYKDREAAAKSAGELERKLLSDRLAAQQESIRIIQEENALSNNLNEDDNRLAEARIALYDLENESIEMQTTLNNKLNSIRKEQTAEIERQRQAQLKLNEAYNEGVKALFGQLDDLNGEGGSPSERLAKERASAIKELEASKNDLIKLAEALSRPTKEIAEGYDTLIEAVENYYKAQRTIEPVAEIEDLTIKVVSPKIEITGKPTIDDKEQSIVDAFFGLKTKITEALGITDEDLQSIMGSIDSILNTALDNVIFNVDRKIEENERYIDSLKENEKELQENLERQIELKDRGAAYDLESAQKALDERDRLEREALKKSEELRKRQAQIQLAADTAQAGSSLLSAAAKTYNANAAIPFGVGLALSAGFIATMFSAFAKYKSSVKSVTRLSSGGALGDYFGYIDKGGQSDVIGRGDGYHVTDSNGNDTGVRFGGNEFLNNERASLLHENGLKNLNRFPNKYSIHNTHDIIKSAVHAAALISNNSFNNKSLETAIEKQTVRLEKAIAKKPERLAIGKDTEKIVTYSEGNKKIENL